MSFLASHRAAGHISGECISVDGGMEGRLLWKETDVIKQSQAAPATMTIQTSLPPPASTVAKSQRRIRIAISVDFDAVSGLLGTGQHPSNGLSDYSAALFSARVGVPRLLKLFKKLGIEKKVTWFIPGHSMESFPTQTAAIVESGCELGLHGYSHEGAYQMTPEQEEAVLKKCIGLAKGLTGKRPVGYRAPLYQIRESTVKLLQDEGFVYDSSMNAHDSLPYSLPHPFPDPPIVPDWSKPAESWMKPLPPPAASSSTSLIEIPTSWYTEDMTPLAFYPYTPNSQGYVSVDVVEKMWWDRWNWIFNNESNVQESENGYGAIFPLIFHPESAGRAHIIGMIEKLLTELVEKTKQESGITFETYESVARDWKAAEKTSSEGKH